MAKLLAELGQNIVGGLHRHTVDRHNLDTLILGFFQDFVDQCTLACTRRTTDISAAASLTLYCLGDELPQLTSFRVATNDPGVSRLGE